MSMPNPTAGLTRPQARRLIARALLLSLLPTMVLIGLYSWLPLDAFAREPIWVSLLVGGALLLAVGFWEVRAILRATYPGIRAVQALSTTVPLFLLLFSALYFVLETNTPETFNVHPLTRVDTLYFTITVFGTVGFGDIAPRARRDGCSSACRSSWTCCSSASGYASSSTLPRSLAAAAPLRTRRPPPTPDPVRSAYQVVRAYHRVSRYGAATMAARSNQP